MRSTSRTSGSALAMALAASAAAAPMLPGQHAALSCSQPAPGRLECDCRWRDGGPLRTVRAAAGAVELPARITGPAPAREHSIAAVLLVDTSDPARAPVIARNIEQIRRMVAAAEPRHALGLMRFDASPRMLVPIGAPPRVLAGAAAGLSATGTTTELYRSALEAVRQLGAVPAARRALFLFSDGLAEDFAYGHEDVVSAALEYGVTIVSLGYPRDVPRSVALQTLRRLAEETAGVYLASTAPDFDLPEAFLAAPFAAVDGGGRLEVDLGPAIVAGRGGPLAVRVTVGDGQVQETFTVAAAGAPAVPGTGGTAGPGPGAAAPADNDAPLQTTRLPDEPAGPAHSVAPAPPAAPVAAPPGPVAGPPAPASAAAARPAAPAPRRILDTWLAYGTPAVILLAVVATLIAYGRSGRRGAPPVPAAAGKESPRGWLTAPGPQPARYPIDATPWRIGRSRNNDLTLADHSVSRRHAEIRRSADGRFHIVDLDSLNGVFVNEKKVRQVPLNEGDAVDIGDVRLRFTLGGEDRAAPETTALIDPRAP